VSPVSFSAEVLAAGQGGHAVVVPKEIAATFSSKRPPVIAQVEGVAYRSRLMVYSGTCYLGLRKDLLRRIQRGPGDLVEIELVEDTESTPAPPPAAAVEPPELLEALAGDPAADAAYQALPPSHRQEYARWIGEAARPETRAERVARTLRRLSGS
jgi:hypothetical protein